VAEAEPTAVLVAARDEAERIAATVAALRSQFPSVEVIVADDGSRDGTAEAAEAAGAFVLRLPPRGKGQALSAAERAAPPGPVLLCDADLEGDLRPLAAEPVDGLVVAAFTERVGGGFGLAKAAARALIRLRTGFDAEEPLSGQRFVSARARRAVFPLAPGFGCETRMTIDAVEAGVPVVELQLPLAHRPTGRDPAGFAHRARQLLDAALATGPLALNHRGARLPLVGWLVGVRHPSVATVAAIGLADDLWSGPERGFRAHLGVGRTTGVLKLVAIPLAALVATRSLSGAVLVGLSANALNQLDTRPGRALKAYLLAAAVLRAPRGIAVLLLPYDLREMTMLGDAGANALGALLGLNSVSRLTGRGRKLAIAALAGLTLLGERRSLGELIERTPGLARLDAWGRL
jgi:glucosyl-3-phosphoglycerate synthase